MTDAESKYLLVLQERFPKLSVKWNPPPHAISELNPCTLTFSSKSDPSNIYQVEFPEGLGNNKIDDDIHALISIHEKQLDSL